MRKALIASTVIGVFLAGCAIMPYDSEFSCNKGPGQGVCGSMTEIYHSSLPSDGNTSVEKKSSNNTYIAPDSENEEVVYALYRSGKVNSIKNVEQDERLAKLEMQSRLLIANNSNMANKFANLPTSMPSVYPVYSPEISKPISSSDIKQDSKKKKEKKRSTHKKQKKQKKQSKCNIGDMCEAEQCDVSVNIREKPCKCSDIVDHLSNDGAIEIIAEKGEWLKTSKGWINKTSAIRKSSKTKISAPAIQETKAPAVGKKQMPAPKKKV